jgi:dihydroorotase
VLKRERAPPGAGGKAATSGSDRFFLGTDSAPHAAALKEQSVCGAGCFTAPAALELYAEAFDAAGALDKLEGLCQPPRPGLLRPAAQRRRVTLKREPWQLPESLPFGDALIKPLRAGETLNWKLQ